MKEENKNIIMINRITRLMWIISRVMMEWRAVFILTHGPQFAVFKASRD